MKSGFCAVVGRPNVGKSTLVNRMVGSKVAITSSRPQTTRNVIRGVLTGDDYQLVLVDTPGLHKPRNELGARLNQLVGGTLSEADVVLFVVDALAPIGPGDRMIADRLVRLILQRVHLLGRRTLAADHDTPDKAAVADR